ncbi:MAG: hypothetical protein ABJ360_19485 [Roseobacter sp.]
MASRSRNAILAGSKPHELPSATTCAITTEAKMPFGSDIVIAQERCRVRSGRMFLKTLPSDKPYVRVAGKDVKRHTACPQRHDQEPDIGRHGIGNWNKK